MDCGERLPLSEAIQKFKEREMAKWDLGAKATKQSHKLTDADVRQIYWMGQNGINQQAIASQFNISTRTVRRILNGETHRQITGEFEPKCNLVHSGYEARGESWR